MDRWEDVGSLCSLSETRPPSGDSPIHMHTKKDMIHSITNGLAKLRYLKTIDRHPPSNSLISAFITAANVKFLLLYSPSQSSTNPGLAMGPSSLTASRYSSASSTMNTGASSSNYTSTAAAAASVAMPASEDNVRNFFNEVYDNWVKVCFLFSIYCYVWIRDFLDCGRLMGTS